MQRRINKRSIKWPKPTLIPRSLDSRTKSPHMDHDSQFFEWTEGREIYFLRFRVCCVRMVGGGTLRKNREGERMFSAHCSLECILSLAFSSFSILPHFPSIQPITGPRSAAASKPIICWEASALCVAEISPSPAEWPLRLNFCDMNMRRSVCIFSPSMNGNRDEFWTLVEDPFR